VKTIQTLIFSLIIQYAVAQECTCLLQSAMDRKDTLYQNGHWIRPGDSIDLSGKTRLNRPSIIIKIQDTKGRTYSVSLSGSLIVLKAGGDKPHSELYETTIGEFFKNWHARSEDLNTKNAEFDWFEYFKDFDADKRLLIVDKEKIPLASKLIKLTPNVSLFACTYTKTDSVMIRLNTNSDSLTLDFASFGLNQEEENMPFFWKLKLGYIKHDKLSYTDISEKIASQIISLHEFKRIIEYLIAGQNRGDEDISKYINLFLKVRYGKYNPFLLDQVQ
jgi:hypothetical protein